MNTNCEHENTSVKNHKRVFEKEIFSYKAETCKDCDAVLWDATLEKKYGAWMSLLYKEKRHIFQIQYSISSHEQSCISKLLERFPNVEESLLIRALIIVYIEMVESEQEILERLESYLGSSDYVKLVNSDKLAKKLQFSPMGFQKIVSYSKLFDMKYSKIVEEVLSRMILLSIKEDGLMKDFWENVILKDIQRIVMAA